MPMTRNDRLVVLEIDTKKAESGTTCAPMKM
jgi:hypothetical protein